MRGTTMKTKSTILLVAALILGIFCNAYSYKLMKVYSGAGTYTGEYLETPKYGQTRNDFVHWNASSLQIYTNLNGAGDGISPLNTMLAIDMATQSWQNVPTSYINLTTCCYTSHTLSSTDGQNTIYWAENGDPTYSIVKNAAAITIITVNDNQELLDVDIIMNGKDVQWSIGGFYDIQSVVTHELGHLLGVHHCDLDYWDVGISCSSQTYAQLPTMYWAAVYEGLSCRTLKADDKEAVTFLYPQGTFTPPAAPALNTPANNEYGVITGPVPISWNPVPGATSYYLEVIESGHAFTWDYIVDKSGLTTNSPPFTNPVMWGLPTGTTNPRDYNPYDIRNNFHPLKYYQWRVTAYNNGIPGLTSEVRTFYTAPSGPPITWPLPEGNNSAYQPRTFTIYWNPFDVESIWQIQVFPYCSLGAHFSFMSSPVIDDPHVTTPSKQITLNPGTYWFRIRAVDEPSDWTYAYYDARSVSPNSVISHDAIWYGNVGLPENTTVNAGKKLTILSGTTITIPVGARLTINGTLELQGNVTIAGGGTWVISSSGTLSVLPGATVKIPDGMCLPIYGTLTANGNSSQQITFDRAANTWAGIQFQPGSHGSLNYCNIRHASYGVYTSTSEPTMHNCQITNNGIGIWFAYAGNVSNDISGNTISNNSTRGIYLDRSSPTGIHGNSISNNGGEGIRCLYGNPVIASNTIAYNSGNGIYLYNSTPQAISGNTINNNGGEGISMYYSNCSITGNTISSNSWDAIYCYNHSAPTILNNLIEYNGNQGIRCEYYSPANLGSAFTTFGHNRFHEMNASIMALSQSNVIAGDVYGYGLNSFYVDQLVMNTLYIDNSVLEADYNWWGLVRQPDAYIDHGGRLEYTTVLDYDPNEGMGKIAAAAGPATNSSLKKTYPKSGAAEAGSFLDADLKNSLRTMLNGNYDDAIQQYAARYKTENDPVKKRYTLVQLGECYRNARRSGFVDYLNSSVRPGLSKEDPLYATTLELEDFFLEQDGNYNQAIANLNTLRSRFAADSATVKYALYQLWILYSHELKDVQKAQACLDELKAKFPKDHLTLSASMLNGEIDDNSSALSTQQDEQSGESNIPDRTELLANYPNPFNPTTRIGFQLSENSAISLKVYDILGREVATLMDGTKEAGVYTSSFDGSKLCSGIYFVRFVASQQNARPVIQVKKMMLVK
jgi:parallel beta-helix repeat protein